MTERVVISGYYGFGNFGDEAILSVLIDRLKKIGPEIVVLSSNPRKTSMDYFVNSINSFDFYQVAGLLKQSDILISGGGSLLQDVTSLKSLVYYLWVIFTALRYKKKVIIFAQGIGPINNKIAKFFTGQILKHCTYVSVRDAKSHNLLEKMGVKSNLLCDPIFSLDIKRLSRKGCIGIQLRDFSSMNDNLLYKLARQIVKDFFDKEIKIFSLQDAIDLEVCKKFQKIITSLNPGIKTSVLNGMSNSALIREMSGLEFMIAMRFHALVVALKAGVKSIAVNYDVKVEKLANEAGLPLISMDAFEDFDFIFGEMKHLNELKLIEFADSHKFDWSGIDEVLLG